MTAIEKEPVQQRALGCLQDGLLRDAITRLKEAAKARKEAENMIDAGDPKGEAALTETIDQIDAIFENNYPIFWGARAEKLKRAYLNAFTNPA